MPVGLRLFSQSLPHKPFQELKVVARDALIPGIGGWRQVCIVDTCLVSHRL